MHTNTTSDGRVVFGEYLLKLAVPLIGEPFDFNVRASHDDCAEDYILEPVIS